MHGDFDRAAALLVGSREDVAHFQAAYPSQGAEVTEEKIRAAVAKTPTVRNVALTAPYTHNGVFGTLEEVVDFYDRGGGPAWGIHLDNQTLPADSLHLSARDRADLVAFMRALTDTTAAHRASRAPPLPSRRAPPAAGPRACVLNRERWRHGRPRIPSVT